MNRLNSNSSFSSGEAKNNFQKVLLLQHSKNTLEKQVSQENKEFNEKTITRRLCIQEAMTKEIVGLLKAL
jgi:hypothetical protein